MYTFDTSLLGPSNPTYATASSHDDEGAISSWSSLIGIITAIVGNVLISFALNIQRYAHIRIDREYHGGKETRKAKKKLPRSLRGYGTAVQQAQFAEERARLNAAAPALGHDCRANTLNEPDEASSLTQHADSTSTAHERDHDVEGGEDGPESQEKPKERKSYLRSPYWWVGITLMAVGEAGNFLAYGFAPASIVSPLGVVALISNCLIAPFMLKERFRKRDFWGVLIAIGGAVTICLSAKTSEAKMGPDKLWLTIRRWEFLAYVCITLVFIAVLMVASPRYGRKSILIDIGLVGLFGGYTALSTKGVAAMLSDTLFRAFTFPITYVLLLVLILSAIMQIRYINRALSNFDSTQVIPTQFVLFTLSVIIGSAVLYRDFEKTDLDHVVRFVAGCGLTFSGVWLITSGRKNSDDDDDDDESEHGEATIRLIDEEAVPERTNGQAKLSFSSSTKANGTASTYNSKQVDTTSIPSITTTPYDSTDSLGRELWSASADQVYKSDRPHTPSQKYPPLLATESTPFFTPATGSSRALERSDSAPAEPMTPTRVRRTSIPEIDPLTVGNTPSTTILRSARGSIQRLVPGPLIQPLSGSLSAIIADSILRGEGSPKHVRDSLRRRRSQRSRGKVPTLSSFEGRPQPTATATNETPPLSRWSTREDDYDATPMSVAISDVENYDTLGAGEGSSATPRHRPKKSRSRLSSFGDTLGGYLNKARGRSVSNVSDMSSDVERRGGQQQPRGANQSQNQAQGRDQQQISRS